MTSWLAVALVACSSSKSQPPLAGSAAPHVPELMKASEPIDLSDSGIADLEIVRKGGAANGPFELHWRAAVSYSPGIVCRVEGYNLVTFSDGLPAHVVGTLDYTVRYRPEPFVIEPDVCEVRFLREHHVVARACYLDGTLTRGPCPSGTFSPRVLPDGAVIDVQDGSARPLTDRYLKLDVLFTLGQELPDRPSFAIRCDGVNSEPDPDEGLYHLLDLSVGETFHSWHVFHLNQVLAADPKQCELRVHMLGKTLGTFCIAHGTTEPGSCESN